MATEQETSAESMVLEFWRECELSQPRDVSSDVVAECKATLKQMVDAAPAADLASLTELSDPERLYLLALKQGLSFPEARSCVSLSGADVVFKGGEDPAGLRLGSQPVPVPVLLENMLISHENGELYLECKVDTLLPVEKASVVIKGDQADYSTVMTVHNWEKTSNLFENGYFKPLKFRSRLPLQGFRIELTLDGQQVPVAFGFSDALSFGCWNRDCAYEDVPGRGVLVAQPEGFGLINDKVWIAKRKFLFARRNKDWKERGGLHTLELNKQRERDLGPREDQKNQFILGNDYMPARENRVNVDYWVPNASQSNLGDYLSVVVCDWMARRKGLSLDTPVGETRFLAAVGSIINAGINDCAVWGSGLLWDECPSFVTPSRKSMDIRALRGPETKRLLEAVGYTCPDVFGDPGMLMPLIYQPEVPAERKPYVLVRHLYDTYGTDVNMLTDDYQGVIDQLVSAELVISSSLHGIILAESYGVPTILLDDLRPDFSLHKYKDWYYSTGRSTFPVARSVEEALQMDPAPLPDLGEVQQRLMDAFPYDLWSE